MNEKKLLVTTLEHIFTLYLRDLTASKLEPRTRLVSSMGRADLLWPRVDLDLTRKVRSNTGRVNVDQWWARLEAGRGGDSFDPL